MEFLTVLKQTNIDNIILAPCLSTTGLHIIVHDINLDIPVGTIAKLFLSRQKNVIYKYIYIHINKDNNCFPLKPYQELAATAHRYELLS
jgi:hypothetical protein